MASERPRATEMRTPRLVAGALALACSALAGASETPVDSLADIGLALLRQGDAPNQVVSPVAAATALGLAHAGLNGPAEAEIEALFGAHGKGPRGFRAQLPALLKQLPPAPFVMANRVWIDRHAAPAVPAGFKSRLATRYGADAQLVDFSQPEAARGRINGWTAERTSGRIAELLPAGSVSAATKLTLTTAMHFRSAWERPFDPALTEQRSFTTTAGTKVDVPMLVDERGVAQAVTGDGTQLLALPFAEAAYTLLVAMPAEGRTLDTLMQSLNGPQLSAWRTTLQPQKCRLALPKFELAPRAGSIRSTLEALGVRSAFTTAADLRPMLGSRARNVHLGDVFHAAGIRIDEIGGEAVAAAAATVVAKSFSLPVPDCAVNRPFLFAVLHGASGAPLFIGRVGDPSAL